MGQALSVVVPFHNEQEVLDVFFAALRPVLERLDMPVEVIAVDDGSTDATPERLRAVQQAWPAVRVVRLSRNFGHQVALTAGIDHASGDAVVMMDGDLQDPPEVIPELVARWRDGCKVVYAVRRTRKGEPFWRRLCIRVFYRLLHRMSPVPIPVDAGDFRLLDRRVVTELGRLRESNRYLRGLTAWVGFRQAAVPYDRPERAAGTSKYPFRRLLNLAWSGMAGFSHVPLRLATYFGLFVSVVSFLLGVTFIVWKLAWGLDLPGWTSIVTIVLFLGGVQLVVAGILGEYLGRVYDEVKGRPIYVVDEVVEPPRAGSPPP